jgi:hypothetical protein
MTWKYRKVPRKMALVGDKYGGMGRRKEREKGGKLPALGWYNGGVDASERADWKEELWFHRYSVGNGVTGTSLADGNIS